MQFNEIGISRSKTHTAYDDFTMPQRKHRWPQYSSFQAYWDMFKTLGKPNTPPEFKESFERTKHCLKYIIFNNHKNDSRCGLWTEFQGMNRAIQK